MRRRRAVLGALAVSAAFALGSPAPTGAGAAREAGIAHDADERDAMPPGDSEHVPWDAALQMSRVGRAVTFQRRPTDLGNLRLTITNHGFFGTDFIGRENPSMEFPAGSLIDHMVRGGLWVGAVRPDTAGIPGATLVSVAAVDGFWQSGTANATEYLPITSIFETPLFDVTTGLQNPGVISEKDYVSTYDDSRPISARDSLEMLGIRVRQQVFTWSFREAEDFVIVNFEITNNSPFRYRDVYLGMYAELVTICKTFECFSVWPPSGASLAVFGFKEIDWNVERKLILSHHCSGLDAESWAGFSLLGTRKTGRVPGPFQPGLPEEFSAADSVGLSPASYSFNWWRWSPARQDTILDADRYVDMSTHDVKPICDASIIDPNTGLPDIDACVQNACDLPPDAQRTDPVDIISVGPFPTFAPGDTLRFAVAFVGGEDEADLVANATLAQRLYDRNYSIPLPPPSPLTLVQPTQGSLVVRWKNTPEQVRDPFSGEKDFEGYRIYIAQSRKGLDADFTLYRDVDSRKFHPIRHIDSVYVDSLLGAGIGVDATRRFPICPDSVPVTVDTTWVLRDSVLVDSASVYFLTMDACGVGAGLVQAFKYVGEVTADSFQVGYNTGLEVVAEPIVIDGETWNYSLTLDHLRDGFSYWVAVTSYDGGFEGVDPEGNFVRVEPLESSIRQNKVQVVTGRPAPSGGVSVFPNPYRGSALWDGGGERERYLWFVNMPARAVLRITTLSGDLVDEILFDAATYAAQDIQGVDVLQDSGSRPVLPGTMYAWDLISDPDQEIATGLYLYSVENRDTGEVQVGKFMVIQ